MKQFKFLAVVSLALAVIATSALARNPLAPDTVFQGDKNEVAVGSTLAIKGTLTAPAGSTVDLTAATGTVIPFIATATLSSGTGASTTATLLSDTAVPAGKKVYVEGFRIVVNGTTAWSGGTLSTVSILNSGTSSPVTYAIAPVASFTASNVIHSSGTNAGVQPGFILGTGGAAAQGLIIKADATAAAGSDLVITAFGLIK